MTKTTFAIAKYHDGKRLVNKATDELTKNHRNDTADIGSHARGSRQWLVPSCSIWAAFIKTQPKVWPPPAVFICTGRPGMISNKPVGRDTFASFLPKLSQEVALSHNYTNHRIRATGTSILSQMNFNSAQIRPVTGHKSVSLLAV